MPLEVKQTTTFASCFAALSFLSGLIIDGQAGLGAEKISEFTGEVVLHGNDFGFFRYWHRSIPDVEREKRAIMFHTRGHTILIQPVDKWKYPFHPEQ